MTQCDMVLEYMERFGSISPMDAFRDLSITRLAARISDLNRRGVKIKKTVETAQNRFGRTIHYTRYGLEAVEP